MANRLQDKVIVITGATKGIGKGIAEMAASEGAHVVISGRSESEGHAVAEALREKYGVDILHVGGDIGDVRVCESLIAQTMKHFGRLDGLVNNAGIFPWASLTETDEALFDRIFNTNIKSAFFCSKYAIEAMKPTGGSIVQVGSTHGYGGFENLAAYACSKGAMLALNKHVARNYAKYKIRSNWITVGWVLSEGESERLIQDGVNLDSLKESAKTDMPMGRLQTVEDMAYAAIYLLSDESAQVSATELHVTGAFNI